MTKAKWRRPDTVVAIEFTTPPEWNLNRFMEDAMDELESRGYDHGLSGTDLEMVLNTQSEAVDGIVRWLCARGSKILGIKRDAPWLRELT
jgi:hypothetical protein